MGYAYNSHIQKFVKGKTIKSMESNADGRIIKFLFTDGECLVLRPVACLPKRPQVDVLATPYKSDGTVKQSLEIEREA